jgi:hypothetical protein
MTDGAWWRGVGARKSDVEANKWLAAR